MAVFNFFVFFTNVYHLFLNWFLFPLRRVFGLIEPAPKLPEIIVRSKGAEKCRKIERMLMQYPNNLINSFDWDTGEETEAAEAILDDSGSLVEDEQKLDLSKSLANSMRQIRGYVKLCKELNIYVYVEERRFDRYNNLNLEHEKQLSRLWKLLMDDELLLSRKSNQWQKIGFQGDDPATDFRGMGILGLDQLVFFAQFDVENCKRVFSISHHPKIGFPFAVAGITITAMINALLHDEMLKNHFYNTIDQPQLVIDHFHQVYCSVYSLFADFWVWAEPESVMEFNEVKRRFCVALEKYLEREDANLFQANVKQILNYVTDGA